MGTSLPCRREIRARVGSRKPSHVRQSTGNWWVYDQHLRCHGCCREVGDWRREVLKLDKHEFEHVSPTHIPTKRKKTHIQFLTSSLVYTPGVVLPGVTSFIRHTELMVQPYTEYRSLQILLAAKRRSMFRGYNMFQNS